MTATTARRPDIDNLRSAATFLLLAFHAAKVYDYSEFYHLKNRATFVGFDVFTGFVHQFHMPLFFALAGWSMAAALKRRGAPEIRKERVHRLLVPLIAWTLITCPWIRWIELDHIDHIHESFLAYLPSFFGLRFSWSHLWFLAYLLTFSLIYLPLFAKLNARTEDPVVTRATLVKFLAGMVAIQVLLRWIWPGFQNLFWDWANFSYYSAFFIGGFCVGRFPSVDKLVDDHRGVMMGIGLVAAACQIPYSLRLVTIDDASDWQAYLVRMPLTALAGVGLVIGILGWARRHFTGAGRVHTWFKESAFGVYLIHQVAVVACAVLVIRTSWPLATKFSVTVLGATVLTVALHEALRRIDVLAPIFGRDRPVTPSGGNAELRPVRTPQ